VTALHFQQLAGFLALTLNLVVEEKDRGKKIRISILEVSVTLSFPSPAN
jgi:hypothetical protein